MWCCSLCRDGTCRRKTWFRLRYELCWYLHCFVRYIIDGAEYRPEDRHYGKKGMPNHCRLCYTGEGVVLYRADNWGETYFSDVEEKRVRCNGEYRERSSKTEYCQEIYRPLALVALVSSYVSSHRIHSPPLQPCISLILRDRFELFCGVRSRAYPKNDVFLYTHTIASENTW